MVSSLRLFQLLTISIQTSDAVITTNVAMVSTSYLIRDYTQSSISSLPLAFSLYPSSLASSPTRASQRSGSVDDVVSCCYARPQTRHREVQSNILGRRTINDFETTLPPRWETYLESSISAAMHAPNHRRTEPWRFYLLGERSKGRVCELQQELVTSSKGMEAGKEKYRRWMAIPGWIVVTCVLSSSGGGDDTNDMNDPTSVARENYAACCCAVQNMCLSLHSRGIGTKWTTGPINFDARFADVVGFRSEEEYVVGTVWFGTPVRIPSMPTKKMGLDNVLRSVD